MQSRKTRLGIWSALALLGLALAVLPGALAQRGGGGVVYSIELPGTIDPATERWVDKALGEARERKAELAILRIDTPGGLDTSMRAIIKDVIAAPMPVVVYVAPNGARAASAGLFIAMGADVAAMAPQTNIGSASPVNLGGGEVDETLGRKIENDAAAFVRALATDHGRNGDLAERMVREAVNVTAPEALERGLIDAVAASEGELLAELDGFRVRGPKAKRLQTKGLEIVTRDMPFQFDLLQLIVNPTIAFLLLGAGLAGIALEVFHPGLIAPGTLGAVALILGLYGTAQLPVTAAGVILLIAALAFFIAETQVTSGVLGGAGVIAFAAGGLLLFDTDSEAVDISAPVVIIWALLIGGFFGFVVRKVLQARRNPVRTGWEELAGALGEVRVALDPVGQVFIEGALWRARSVEQGQHLEVGYKVRVESVDGLTLTVRPVEEEVEEP